MAVLPMSKAKGLGDFMAKRGVAAIAMKAKPAYDDKPSSDSGDEESDPADEDKDKSELEHCVSDVADAVESGDKEAIKSALMDLVDCIKQDDSDQDSEDQLGS